MNDPRQPPRLFGSPEAPPALRAALEGARNAGPSARQIEQLVAAVETRLGNHAHLDPAFDGAHGAGLPSAGVRLWLRWLIAGAGVGAAMLAGLLLSRGEAARQPGVDGAAPAVLPAASEQTFPRSGGDRTPRRASTPPQELDKSTLPHGVAVQPSAAPVKPSRAPRGALLGVPSASASPDSPSASASLGAPAGGPDEFQLLRRARAALSRDPGAALRLAEEHAQRFGRGMLAQEREAIAVEALARLGRASEARARAQRLLHRYPDSPYRTRLESLTAPGRSGGGPQ